MACACGGKSSAMVAYAVTFTKPGGERVTEYVEDIGAYRMLRNSVTASGGAVSAAVQVPRATMDEWLKAQEQA
jgi:hypothetical protein